MPRAALARSRSYGSPENFVKGSATFLFDGIPDTLALVSEAEAPEGIEVISTGAKSLNDLFPLVYYAVLLSGAIGLLAVGGFGLAGRGPLGRS